MSGPTSLPIKCVNNGVVAVDPLRARNPALLNFDLNLAPVGRRHVVETRSNNTFVTINHSVYTILEEDERIVESHLRQDIPVHKHQRTPNLPNLRHSL